MATPPPGWYDDPAGSRQLRFWDGERWTDQLIDRPEQGEPDAGGQAAFWPFERPGAPPEARNRPLPRRLAADGAPLAPWWRRLLAWLVDYIIATVLALPASLSILTSRFDQLDAWYRAVQSAAASGADMPAVPEPLLGVIAAAGVATTLVYFLYELIGLTRFGTTWGRRLLGVVVRVDGLSGPLPAEAVGRRAGVKVAGQVAGGVAVLADLGLLFMLVDLGRGIVDRDRRTLHDLAGGTDVVLARGAADRRAPRRG